MFAADGTKQSLDKLLKGYDTRTWGRSLFNELYHISQDIGDVKGNGVVDYIYKLEVPCDRVVTYSNIIWNFQPLKTDQYYVRLTVGGD